MPRKSIHFVNRHLEPGGRDGGGWEGGWEGGRVVGREARRVGGQARSQYLEKRGSFLHTRMCVRVHNAG